MLEGRRRAAADASFALDWRRAVPEIIDVLHEVRQRPTRAFMRGEVVAPEWPLLAALTVAR